MLRNALVDLYEAGSPDADILSYLDPKSELWPKVIAPKPDSVDTFDDAVIDPVKWATHGSVTEVPFLGIDGLMMDDPVVPGYDQTGIIYKPSIAYGLGKMVIMRALCNKPVEFIFSLQEYDFTVDSIVLPTTWDLKYDVAPQDLRNSMGLRWAPGALYFFEGGSAGNEEYVSELPTKLSSVRNIYPLQVVFVFTLTGWDIYAHIPGVWAAPRLVKQYTRPGGVHNVSGYSLCVNKYTADDILHFYALAWYFKSNVLVQGARILTANTTDDVAIGSITTVPQYGVNGGQTGTFMVRIPDYSPSLFTLDEVAEITEKMTGKNVYELEFVLGGDVGLVHPVRVAIDDKTLPMTAGVSGS